MNHMILTPNLQTTLFKQSSKHVYIFHYLFKSMGGTTKYENPGKNTELVKVYIYTTLSQGTCIYYKSDAGDVLN